MTKRYVLAVDQGTTGTTVSVYDHDGRVRGRGYRELKQIYPCPGWVEHDPEEIWQTVLSAVDAAMAGAGVKANEVAAVGITNQRETTLLWDRATGHPVHNAIVWQCRRTAGDCDKLVQMGAAEEIRAATGLVVDAYFSGTKIAWMLDHIPGLRERAERGEVAFGTVDSWLLWKLTGGSVHATDFSNASRTMLFNVRRLEWDDRMLELMRVPRGLLPKLVPSSGVAGETSSRWGAPPGIPIAGIAGDQQAALFGQGCFAPGEAKCTYGTGAFLLVNTGRSPVNSRRRLLTTVAWSANGEVTYALEGSVFVCGAAVQWLRDGLGIISSAAETEGLARSVEDTGGVYFVPAFVGLGAPHWNPHARGLITGITRGTTRAHLARAALEAIAYQVADLLAEMQAGFGSELAGLRVDGGAAANNWLMQFQADVLGLSVLRPANVETTAAGAAGLAGLGVGFWRSEDELLRIAGERTSFRPQMEPEHRRRLLDGWHRAVAAANSEDLRAV
ncbi:MAG: glycerol kinase GlpK [Armatimonadota bacterium]